MQRLPQIYKLFKMAITLNIIADNGELCLH